MTEPMAFHQIIPHTLADLALGFFFLLSVALALLREIARIRTDQPAP